MGWHGRYWGKTSRFFLEEEEEDAASSKVKHLLVPVDLVPGLRWAIGVVGESTLESSISNSGDAKQGDDFLGIE